MKTIVRSIRQLRPELFDAALAAAIARYPSGNAAGVFGASIRPRQMRGRRQRQLTVALFVSHKNNEPPVPITPIRFRYGQQEFEIAPDVIATGREAVAGAGQSGTFTGLHAGAALRADTGLHCRGGVACLLAQQDDPTYLVTAGHLFPPNAGPVIVLAASAGSAQPEQVGTLELNLLDGAGTSVDAALVKLTPAGQQMALNTGQASAFPRLTRTAFPSDMAHNVWLRVFLPLTGDYVADLGGQIRKNQFQVESGCRAPHEISNVIETDFAHNAEGNSGTILMTDDRSGGVAGQGVGVAVGFAGQVSLHEPLDRALSLFQTATGNGFRIWSQP